LFASLRFEAPLLALDILQAEGADLSDSPHRPSIAEPGKGGYEQSACQDDANSSPQHSRTPE
jgi:hypothetical protein